MKLGVIVGEDSSGKWHAVALPDKSVQDQRAIFKQIKVKDGMLDVGKKPMRLVKAMFFDNYTKRAFFRHDIDAPVAPPDIT